MGYPRDSLAAPDDDQMTNALPSSVSHNRCGNTTVDDFLAINHAVRAITASESRVVRIECMGKDRHSHG